VAINKDIANYGRSSGGGTSPEAELNTLVATLKQSGYDVKPKESALQKVARILNTPRAYVAGIQKYGAGGLLGRGVTENLDSAKLLEDKLKRPLTSAEKVKAFGMDVLLDPITYLTFGTGTGAKIAASSGLKALTKGGTQALKKAGETAAKDIAETLAQKGIQKTEQEITEAGLTRATREFTRGVDSGAAEYSKYLDKGGIKLQVPFTGEGNGLTLISGEKLAPVVDKTKSLVKSIPVVGDTLKTVKDSLGRTFGSRYYDIEQAAKTLRASGSPESIKVAKQLESYVTKKNDFYKLTATEQAAAVNRMAKLAKGIPETERENILGLIERLPTKEGYQVPTEVIQQNYDKGRTIVEQGKKELGEIGKQIQDVSDLSKLPGMNPERLAKLNAVGIKTIDDLNAAITPKLSNVLDKAVAVTRQGANPYKYIKTGEKIAKGLKVRAGDAIDDFVELIYKKEAKIGEIGKDLKGVKSAIKEARGSVSNITDPAVRASVTALKNTTADIAFQEKKRGILKNEIVEYVHRILTPAARAAVTRDKLGFIGFNKELSTSIGAANKKRSVLGTIAENEELLKNKYGVKGDFYIKDPFLTTTVREQTSIQARNTFDFLRDVGNKMGVKATPAEIAAGSKIDPATGIRYVAPTNKVLREAGVMVPDVIAKDVDKMYETLTNMDELKAFTKYWDKAQNVWKQLVTGPFPAFHARNLMGATYNNWLAGMTNIQRYKQADQVIRLVNKYEKGSSEVSTGRALEELKNLKFKNSLGQEIDGMKLMAMYDVKIGRNTGHLGDIVNDTAREVGVQTWKDKAADTANYGRKILEFTEERVRLPLFLDTWMKTGSFDAAGKAVARFHFDYTPQGLTEFEDKVMRRIIPFYRWIRNNIPLQFEQILKQPGKQNAALRGSQAMVDPDIQSQLPEYMQQGTAFQIGPEKNGNVSILTGFGLPFEDINKLSIDQLASSISPLLKVPIEEYMDKSLYYKKPVTESGQSFAKYYAEGPMSMFNPGNWLNIQQVTRPDGTTYYTGDAKKLYAIQAALGRLATTAGKASNTDAPTSVRLMAGLTGVDVKTVDLAQEKYYKDQKLLDAYSKALVNKGILKKSSNYYKPKGTMAPINDKNAP